MRKLKNVRRLLRRLRDPVHGCDWNKHQTFESVVPYTVEEAYEVADAVERGDWLGLPDELGDLLYQVLYLCDLGESEGRFTFEYVLNKLEAKIVDRNPHVFRTANQKYLNTSNGLRWEQTKSVTRKKAGISSELDNIPKKLPIMSKAKKMQARAAGVGFDWPDRKGVWAKVEEELNELQVELLKESPQEMVAEELGDLMFTLISLGRHVSVDAESALRQATTKFENRFRAMEAKMTDSKLNFRTISVTELDNLWNDAKQEEKNSR